VTDYQTQAAVEPSEWTLYFPYATNPLSLNGPRGRHYLKNQWVKRVRNETIAYIRQAGIPPLGRARAGLIWFVLTSNRRDVDNLAPLEKVMFDAMVRAGLVPDDTPDLLEKLRPQIVTVDRMTHREAWMELRITRWDGAATQPAPTTTGYVQSTITKES